MAADHTVLFVDDDKAIVQQFADLLQREEFDVATASNAKAGFSLLRDRSISLAIVDESMPEILGADFLEEAATISPDTIRILLTSSTDEEEAIAALGAGKINRYLSKPWDDQQLKMTIREALTRFNLEEQNRQLTSELQEKNDELEGLNTELERKIVERTRELRERLKELEARDRIAQHVLTVHTLRETLDVLLDIMVEVLRFDRALILLLEDGEMRPAAAIGVTAPMIRVPAREVGQLRFSGALETTISLVPESMVEVRIDDEKEGFQFGMVPVQREGELIGVIEFDNHRTDGAISDDELQTMSRLALPAAVAIHDALIHQDVDDWKGHLDKVLQEMSELRDRAD